MFEAFSARGRSVVERAHDESHRLGHPHVGTEHLLLGVLVAEDGAAPAVLGAAGVGVNACRRKVAEAVAGGAGRNAPGTALTPRATRALERAFRFSRQYQSEQVEPEHVLLAVLDVEGTAGQVLRGLGVDVDGLRRELDAAAHGPAAPPPGSEAGTETETEPPGEPAPGPAVAAGAAPVADDHPGAGGGADGDAGPRCPSCGGPLAGALAHRVMAAWAESGPPRQVVVVYCSQCDSALGAAPA